MSIPPKSMSDVDLETQIRLAEAKFKSADHDRRSAGSRTSDDGLIALDEAYHHAERLLNDLMAEKTRRKASKAGVAPPKVVGVSGAAPKVVSAKAAPAGAKVSLARVEKLTYGMKIWVQDGKGIRLWQRGDPPLATLL